MPEQILQDLARYSTGKDFREGHVFLIDKPLGWTSFNVVGKVKFLLKKHLHLKKVKVGHAGTLDPLATGLMVVCVGKATRVAGQLTLDDKEYVATFTLGATTPSYDLETAVDETFPTEHITPALLQQAAQSLTGEIMQEPPLFSAKRVEGKRAYDVARKGKTVELKPVPITIHAFEIQRVEGNLLTARIACSKGTYIRALARDFGRLLKSGAHLSALRRTKSGAFHLQDAITVQDLEAFIETIAPLYPPKAPN